MALVFSAFFGRRETRGYLMLHKFLIAVTAAGFAAPVAAATFNLEDTAAAGVYVDDAGFSGSFDISSYLNPGDTLLRATLSVSIADDGDEVMTGTSTRSMPGRWTGRYEGSYRVYEQVSQTINYDYQPADRLSLQANGTALGDVISSRISSSIDYGPKIFTGSSSFCGYVPGYGYTCNKTYSYHQTVTSSYDISGAATKAFNLMAPQGFFVNGVLNYTLAAKTQTYYGQPFLTDATVTKVALNFEVQEAISVVPLPASGLMLLGGAGALGFLRRRGKARA